MASTNHNLDTLNGLFKEVYAEKIQNLIPDGVKLYKNVKFVPKQREPGNFYNQPVVLGLEHGATFADDDDGAFDLNSPIVGQIKNAQVRGNQLVLRSVLSLAAASRATQGGTQAFEDSTKFLVANMMRSITKKLEIEMFYGGTEYGLVDSTAGNVVTITTAEWAPGIWAGSENLRVEFRDTTGATLRGDATVTSVDMANRTITVDSLPAGVVATDRIFHYGAHNKEFSGLHAIMENSSTLFGIDASAYSLWKSNSYAVGGALTFADLDDALARAVEKGLDSDVSCYVNVRGWSDLMIEQAGKRSYDSSYSRSQFENGAETIKYFSQNGKIEIIPSIYVKEGFAYLVSHSDFMRVGSTEVTFKRPGREDEFFRDLENSAGYELRCYTDQALFCMAPGRQTILTGIANS